MTRMLSLLAAMVKSTEGCVTRSRALALIERMVYWLGFSKWSLMRIHSKTMKRIVDTMSDKWVGMGVEERASPTQEGARLRLRKQA